jgi:uncharacterized protein (DUF58 family)
MASHPPAPSFRKPLRLLRVGGLLAVALVAGLIHARALAAVAVVAAVLLAAWVLPWLAVRRVRALWHYPARRGQVGKPLAVRLTLRSALPWPAVGLLVRGGWTEPGGAEDPLTVAVARVPARGEQEIALTVVPEHRGHYPRSAPAVATGFPFGLWQSRRLPAGGQILVWPAIVPLPAAAGDAGGRAGQRAVRSRRTGQHGEFFGTRPYRVGESLRRIHWKQSARHDELIVWEAQAVSRGAVLLLLETAPHLHARHEDGDSLEKTLSVGASIAAALLESGVPVTLAFRRGRPFRIGNRQQLEAALDALAQFDPNQGTDLAGLLDEMPRELRRGRVPWVVTTLTGWRQSDHARRGGRFVVIDDRSPRQKESPPPGKVALVPLVDPGHRRLLAVWKEVAVVDKVLV